ncbi:MAG: NADH-quinone oxidoreductase subunit A [Desulfohalobiaceae bacterium]|nr:NADH-quinone oxidoreductase subunit A [Desulfohalobiaceae bacterium]
MEPLPARTIMTLSPWEPGLLSLAVYCLMIVLLLAIILFLTSWLGVKRDSPEKARPYESGIIPTGSARFRYPAPFYLVAIFFLIFDVEGLYIFSWAVVFRDLGWKGWLQMTFFILVLVLSLVYIWRKGGLDWVLGGRR